MGPTILGSQPESRANCNCFRLEAAPTFSVQRGGKVMCPEGTGTTCIAHPARVHGLVAQHNSRSGPARPSQLVVQAPGSTTSNIVESAAVDHQSRRPDAGGPPKDSPPRPICSVIDDLGPLFFGGLLDTTLRRGPERRLVPMFPPY